MARFPRLWLSSASAAVLALQATLAPAADGGLDAGSDAQQADGGLSPSDVIAVYCSDADLECTTAPLFYAKTIELPIAFDFDTDWVPQGGSLQVRFFLKIPASTTVELEGALETTWPEAMTLATPGGQHGLLKFDYGLDIGAKAKIDTTLVNWEGNIPFVPQVSWHLTAETKFAPWAFAPGASASAVSPEVRIFEYNLLDMLGIPSAISKGGVALDVKGDLKATYQTDRIRIEPSVATDAPITSQDGTTTRTFPGGAFVEYDVFPEGRVDYDGTLHLIPTFFAEIIGKDYSLPIIDIPVTFDIGKQDFVFDPVRVHVPLPDLEPVAAKLDFGTIAFGSTKTLSLDLDNVGEAKARASGVLGASSEGFSVPTTAVLVEPAGSALYPISFTPKRNGAHETLLTLVTNDPDERFLKVLLTAKASGGEIDGGLETTPEAEDSGGCGCRTTPAPSSGTWLFLAALALGATRRHSRKVKP